MKLILESEKEISEYLFHKAWKVTDKLIERAKPSTAAAAKVAVRNKAVIRA